LTDDFTFASFVSDTANATLPDRSDSGIFYDWITFNLRDQIREKENDPLQFKYIPANCRLYYKLNNVYNMPQLWHDVAKANWNDQSLCVPGSTGVADNSIEPPPPMNITVIPPIVNWPVNNTILDSIADESGGIQDGRPGHAITACDSCTGTCESVSIRCSNKPNTPETVEACLPSCILRTGSSCPAGTNCIPTGQTRSLASKSNSIEKKSISSASQGLKQDILGICKPGSTFVQKTGSFGCTVS